MLDSCRALEAEGFKITYLPVQTNGILSLEELEKAITPDTSLVSVMAVNNEIGVKQPIAEIGKICRKNKIFFHTDAAQAVGKVPIDVQEMQIDLMSISGHKLYGPKGLKGTVLFHHVPFYYICRYWCIIFKTATQSKSRSFTEWWRSRKRNQKWYCSSAFSSWNGRGMSTSK